MFGNRLKAIVLVLFAFAAACDHMPSDPTLDPELDKALHAAESAAGTTAPNTLPDLLRRAITRTNVEQGRDAALRLTSTWLQLNEDARAAIRNADRQSAYARLSMVHAEELRIVLAVYGGEVVTTVIEAVEAGLHTAREQLTEASLAGKDVARSANLLEDIAGDLIAARGAARDNQLERALDRATTAAVTLSAVRSFIGWLNRIDGLEVLFPQAIAKLERVDSGSAREAKRTEDRLTAAMQSALSAGDHPAARRASEQLRAHQISTVLRVHGAATARRLTAEVGDGLLVSRARLDELQAAGREVGRYVRMFREAGSLHERAQAALNDGDTATALDLASHAAGLLNALAPSLY